MASLIEVDSKRTYSLGQSTVIGRADTCQIRVDDPMVSASHATIEKRPDGTFQIRDLNSRRGTYVGSRKVTEAALRDGDELLIGAARLRFEDDRPIAQGSQSGSQSTSAMQEELVRLRAIVELGRAIGVEHDLERLLGRVLDTCFQLLRADRGAIVIYEPHSKAPFLTVTRARQGNDAFAVSTAVMSQVMATHEPYLRTEVDSDAVLQRSESLTAHGVRSVMAVPLRYDANETEWLGVILLDSSAMLNVFRARDLELLEAISGPTALAIKNAMLVRQVQSVISEEWTRLDRTVRDLPIGVLVIDDRKRCVLVNQWLTARGEDIGALVPGATVDAVASVPCDELVAGDIKTHIVSTESDRILSMTANVMSGGRETVVVVCDITEERERQAQAAHRDRVAMIGQLAGGVAHDFNNLLHVILTYASMLEESLPDPDARDDAHQITHAAASAAELTRQLLTFSRRELVKPKVVDVPHVVHGIEKMLVRTLGPQIDYVSTIGPRIPRILIDTSQLEQIVMNLVVNARDAMRGKGRVMLTINGVTVEADRARARGIQPGRYVQIEVADEGEGMPPEVVARIFEPYFTTKSRGKGTGLGLATVHGIVQQAQGDITVESIVGRGTTFRIFLPATDQVGGDVRAAEAAPPGGAKILVVDDDDNVRRVTERSLKSAGYDVFSVSSGQAALELVREGTHVFDLVLTDVVMPGMSGRDLARELAAHDRPPRVVFMSGYHQHAPMPNSQFLPKPFHRAALLEKVRDALTSDFGATCVVLAP
ncbi:MAG TPA: ATP-binding protein [Kofleriaceae bacterium]|nr:ATP-binding protein [Kofleriaceae bacterium]